MMNGNGRQAINFNSTSSSSLSSTSSFGSSSMMSPRSPPSGSIDLYGRRRQMVRVQMLEREIALLQDELKSIESVQAASGCCKELDDFIKANTDPLIVPPDQPEPSCVSHLCWKRLCNLLLNHEWNSISCRSKLCCEAPRISCFRGCSCQNCCSETPVSCLCCHSKYLLGKTQGSCRCCCPSTTTSCSCRFGRTGSCCKRNKSCCCRGCL